MKALLHAWQRRGLGLYQRIRRPGAGAQQPAQRRQKNRQHSLALSISFHKRLSLAHP
ncbi:MAG: hypothetical protein ACLUE8_12820 [Lachnospiraceae bacterium]